VRHSVFFHWQMAFSWWVSGIPYDVIHCVSNTVLVFVLFPPLRRALERAKKTSGGRE
jgi:energy-coupling factor transport system substrate-specific component